MLGNLRSKACAVAMGLGTLFGLMAAPARLSAEGLSAIKVGWAYEIGLPDDLQDAKSPQLGLGAGVNAYRVLAQGGEGWYQVQRIRRHSNGTWYAPRGAKEVWLNLSYAYLVNELK